MRYPRHLSIILQFITTEQRLRDKRHFHRPLRGGDKGKEGKKKNVSLGFFRLISFMWTAAGMPRFPVCAFPTRFLPVSLTPSNSGFFFFLFFSQFPPEPGSGSWTWYGKLPVLSVMPLAMHCIACKFQKLPPQQDLPVTKFIVFGKWRHRGSPLMWRSLIPPLS